MELPTYTSIWRIERRLYKLYDFRLPIPLPVGQITVFAGICLPYVAILGLLGVPFSHTLFWLYVLPPGLLTWLVTRPVLQGKRLPELLRSQVRYLAEPRLLCRMAPFAERDVVVVTGRVWRIVPATHAARAKPVPQRRMSDRFLTGRRPETAGLPGTDVADPRRRGPAWLAPAPDPAVAGPEVAERAVAQPAVAPVAAEAEPAWAAGPPTATFVDVDRAPRRPWVPGPMPSRRPAAAGQADSGQQPGADGGSDSPDATDAARAPENLPEQQPQRQSQPQQPQQQSQPERGPDSARGPEPKPAPQARGEQARYEPGPSRQRDAGHAPEQARATSTSGPARRVVATGQRTGRPISVEQALAGKAARRGQPPGGRAVPVPGGDRPGGQDQFQRDRARVRLPIAAARRVVVLGCTVGAGQTTTALFCAEVLASLRSDPVAVLDLNPAPAGLTALAAARPALSRAAALGASRLAVLTASGAGERAAGAVGDGPAPGSPGTGHPGTGHPETGPIPAGALTGSGGPAADLERFARAAAGRRLVLADPAAGSVPRLLGIADQLVLVAPASDAAASAIAMTLEWLEAHGHADLVHGAIVVVNGASRRSMSHVQQAERICVGRCRAIVRIPWDDQLNRQQQASPAASGAGRPDPAAGGRQRWTGVLDPATFGAYSALAGVLVAALASQRGADEAAADRGQARVGAVDR